MVKILFFCMIAIAICYPLALAIIEKHLVNEVVEWSLSLVIVGFIVLIFWFDTDN